MYEDNTLVNGEIVWITAGRDRGRKAIVTRMIDPRIVRLYLYEEHDPHFTESDYRQVISTDLDRPYTDDEQHRLVYAGTGHGWCVRCDDFGMLNEYDLCPKCKPISRMGLAETQRYNTEVYERFGLSGGLDDGAWS